MAIRITLAVALIALLLFSTAAVGESDKPVTIPDSGSMDKVMEEAMQENLLAHRIRRRHIHRWYRNTPRSSVVIYYSSTPRYRNYYVGDSYRAAKIRCDRRYRSYNWRTDKFTTYSGVKKLCPYVRPFY